MTRPEWQKKKKKMAGREGPKKGKNRQKTQDPFGKGPIQESEIQERLE